MQAVLKNKGFDDTTGSQVCDINNRFESHSSPDLIEGSMQLLNLKTKSKYLFLRKNLVSFVMNEFQKVLDKILSSMKG